MRKVIDRGTHGLLDYATMAALFLAPRFLRMPKRAVPWKAHGAVDTLLGVAIPALPWVIGVSRNRNARNLFLGLAAVTLVVTALTDWADEDDAYDFADARA
jgi:hypothetical protein